MHECNLVGDFKDFGKEAPPTLAGMQTKLDQLSFNGIGKDSGFGDSRQAIGYPWQTEVWRSKCQSRTNFTILIPYCKMIGGTISTASHPACSSLSELAGPPLVRISFVKSARVG